MIPLFDSLTRVKQFTSLGSQKKNPPLGGFFCEPIAWLSELAKHRNYISLAIEKLESFVIG
jgi:hypothetical protein